ncbi:MAG: ABC transporter permease [Burkholderiales bacterium]|nr:ABC transporter permease [Burkholderiales bacterium]
MLAQIVTIARYTLLEALCNRLLWLVLLSVFLGLGFSLFLQQIALIESRQIQLGALAVLYRLFAVFFLASFVIAGMLREYHDKGVEFFLAMPMTRSIYFFGKLLGYATASFLLATLYSLPLFWGNEMGSVLLWGISLFLELLLMGSVSFFFAITLTQIPSAMAAVFGFYLLSRSMGTLSLIMNGPLAAHDFMQEIVDMTISGVGFFIPRLDGYTQTSWLIYPGSSWHELLPVALQTAIYMTLVSSAALFDFCRKNL